MTVELSYDVLTGAGVEPGEEAAGLTKVADHGAEALARLLEQFHNMPRIEALVRAFVDPLQALEDAYWQLLEERSIDDSVGKQLIGLAEIVGQEWQGLTEDELRVMVRVRIRVNRSDGTPEDLIAVMRAAVGAGVLIVYKRQGPAMQSLEVRGVVPGAVRVARALVDASLAGVRTLLESAAAPIEETLLWSSSTGTTGQLTWGTTTEAGVGGKLATVNGE